MDKEKFIRANPSKRKNPPIYMGLRTYRYNPADTNSLGESNGAGVPLPEITNVIAVVNAIIPPAASNIIPGI